MKSLRKNYYCEQLRLSKELKKCNQPDTDETEILKLN